MRYHNTHTRHLLIFGLLLLFSLLSFARPVNAATTYYKVSGTSDGLLALRKDHTTKADLIGNFKEGDDCIKGTGNTSGSWKEVIDGAGTKGWSFGTYLKTTATACTKAVAVATPSAAAAPGSAAPSTPKKTDTSVTIVKLDNPLSTTSVDKLLGNFTKAALQILGSLALVAFVVGGFLWLTSGGNPERVKKGSQTMVWAGAGIFLVLGSYAILNTIITSIGATGTGALKGGSSVKYYKVVGTTEKKGDGILQVREKPKDSSKSLGFFKEGEDCVKATGKEDGSWYEVEYKQQILGWSYSAFLKETSTNCAEGGQTGAVVSVCKDMKTCWYTKRKVSAIAYQQSAQRGEPKNIQFPKPYWFKSKQYVCFDIGEQVHDYIRLDMKYKDKDVWLNIYGSHNKAKKVTSKNAADKAYFARVVPDGTSSEKAAVLQKERCKNNYLTELKLNRRR